MEEVTWTVTEASGEVKTAGKRAQLPYWAPFEVKEGNSKEMKVTIERWNLMQQRLLDTGEMKSK